MKGVRSALGAGAFLAAGLCLWALLLLVYPRGNEHRILCYGLVLLCAGYGWACHGPGADGVLSLMALWFTAGADFFLVALHQEQPLPGMSLFCLAQLCWALRLFQMESWRRRLCHGVSWLGLLGLLLVIAVVVARGADALLLLSAVYASLLLTTAFFSLLTRKNGWFSLGMLLFVGCDLFVMVNNAGAYLVITQHPLLQALYAIPFNMMWAFYGPSQMLLALSARGEG